MSKPFSFPIGLVLSALLLPACIGAGQAPQGVTIPQDIKGARVVLQPANFPLGPDGGDAVFYAFATASGHPLRGIGLVVSKSNPELTILGSLVKTDSDGSAPIRVNAIADGRVCIGLASQPATPADCPFDRGATSGVVSSFITVARPQITLFAPTGYKWTGSSTHKMTIIGTNFSTEVAVLVASNPAVVKRATKSLIEVEFSDPRTFGDAALTYVTVINLPTSYKDTMSGISFTMQVEGRI